MYVAYPFPARLCRWAHPRVVGTTAVAQGLHGRAVLFDPCAYLIGSADGPVTRDDDIDVVRHALEQPQPNKVVLNRVSGVVEHRNQDIRQHVARHENPTFFDQQRRMAGGMSRMLNIPDSRPSQGPVLTSPRPALFGAGGMAAILEGTLAFDGDCLRLIRGDIEYPVVWPAGASWEPDPPSVVLLGQSIEPGATVSGEGGYLSRDHVEQRAGSQVADAAARCAGPTGEIAFFNIGSEIEVTSG